MAERGVVLSLDEGTTGVTSAVVGLDGEAADDLPRREVRVAEDLDFAHPGAPLGRLACAPRGQQREREQSERATRR